MIAINKSLYNKEVGNRLKEIMLICGLELDGFASFINSSASQLYALLNGNRRLTKEKAEEIGNILGFDGSLIFNLNVAIPVNISKSAKLNNFKIEFKENPEYFTSTLPFRKKSKFVSNQISSDDFLVRPAYLWEIKDFLNGISKDINFDSDELSKILNYFVKKKLLSKEKRPLKSKRTGALGKRFVDVFFKSHVQNNHPL
jgi:plasmid maintenance system antidote protein VapI